MKVSVGADKKWLRLRWKDGQGKYKILYPGCENNSEGSRTAQRIALQMEEDFEKGNFDYSLAKYKVHTQQALQGKTFGEIYQQWVKKTKNHLTQRTINAYNYLYNSIYPSGIFSFNPNTISINEIFALVDYLKKSNKPNTIKFKLSILFSVWDWGQKSKLILNSDNPFKEIKIQSSGHVIDPFTREEIRKILEAATEEKKLFIKFLLLTGCRIGEAIGLHWDDLSPECQSVTIHRQFTGGKFKPLKKGGRPRTFSLPVSFAQELKSQSRDSDFVFGEPMTLSQFRRVWIKNLELAGVRYRKPYNCRHTFVCLRLQEGWKPNQIVQVTGHSLQVMFQSYATFIAEKIYLPDLD